ncbi:MAG TPA: L,D-transpeptidase family protein [Roseiarcus sp.]|nr:L,D-transpeptidase family protein [Roseiarcus sp.]
MKNGRLGRRLIALCLAASSAALLAACEEEIAGGPGRSLRPIPADTVALMEQKDTAPASPVLIRTYKKEAEFEIWKMKSDGRYVLLKTYPMCRWSGQLGPKTHEGDMQVPEGFYPITPAQMNPNSNYYLSFNVGYPNAYDRVFGRTGGSIMVHGACSSAGCFSMTDAQIAEIYAIAREAFNGGQREIQMQSYPFHMTAENLAKHRLDPNMDFWKELKTGSDHFEVSKTEPVVGVCGKRYVFDAKPSNGRPLEASTPCPALDRDDAIEQEVAAKQAKDDAEVAELVKEGVKPIELVYQDGGQNAHFRSNEPKDVSDPEALAAGPREIALDDHGKPIPAVVAAADAARASAAADGKTHASAKPEVATPAPSVVASAPPVAQPPPAQTGGSGSPFSKVLDVADSSGQTVKKWFGFSGDTAQASELKVFEPAEPIPTDVPLPPRRDAAAANSTQKPQASLVTPPRPEAAAPRLQQAAAPAPWIAKAAALDLASTQSAQEKGQ